MRERLKLFIGFNSNISGTDYDSRHTHMPLGINLQYFDKM